jgi:acyl-coenzyme A thioesterase PaaI-like protein
MSVYPPYLGANVRVASVSPDATRFVVTMRLRFWNQNYFGTHFGGSLYSMCDPFFVLILSENLGPGYAVWDKAATIRFLKPGRGTVRATFEIAAAEIERIRERADREGRIEERFSVQILGGGQEVVAEVEKLLHINKRLPRRSDR